MAAVTLDKVVKQYGEAVIVKGLDLAVASGEFVVLVGPSGCGKTTTLRMIAGLEDITSGTLAIDGKVMNQVPPANRDIAMVFQSYALYPHMTVGENMAFGLRLRKVPQAEINRRVGEAADILSIGELLQRRPKALSGGQRQRVAVGRAIVRNPKVFLFDEPLSNLDAKLRVQMRRELTALQRRLGTTSVYVTHDQVEAMTMGSRIAVMSDGLLRQFGTPDEVYSRPADRFTATFIGSPQMNILSGVVESKGGRPVFVHADFRLALPEGIAPGPVELGLRPEDITLGDSGIPAVIDFLEPLGAETIVTASTGTAEIQVRVHGSIRPSAGDKVHLTPDPVTMHAFDPATGRRIPSTIPALR